MEVVFGQWGGGGRSHILWSLDESPVIYTVSAVGLYASSQCMLAMVSSSPFPKSCMTSLEISKMERDVSIYNRSETQPANAELDYRICMKTAIAATTAAETSSRSGGL